MSAADPSTGTDRLPLPQDPDLETDPTMAGATRPPHLRPGSMLLVFAGGTIGAGLREILSLAFPPLHGIPSTILAINVVGALLLGLLLELLSRRGPDEGRRRAVRLAAGTGVLGGFTTYSALATDAAALIGEGRAGAGIGCALATLLLGGLATWAGIALGTLLPHRRRGEGARP